MWELDYKESWALKNWCFLLEKILESPLDCKEIQPVQPKGDQSWVFIGETDAEAETPILWPPHEKSWLIGKDPDARKDWGQEEKGMTEDEMVEWHHWLNGHGFEWTPGVGDGQEGLACHGSWGRKESDMTEGLNWTELKRHSDSETTIKKCHRNFTRWWLIPASLLFPFFFLFFLSFGHTTWHAELPQPGIEPMPTAVEVLTTGPLGKSSSSPLKTKNKNLTLKDQVDVDLRLVSHSPACPHCNKPLLCCKHPVRVWLSQL